MKKVSKKRTSKKKNSEQPISKKNFETFQIGVERLKELKKELDSLDTRGFDKEEKAIRSKLKNVSEIPNIERAIKSLKLKIRKKYRPAKRKKPSTKKIIGEGLEDIHSEIKKIGRSRKEDFQDIKSEIKKLKETKSRVPMDSEVDILVDKNFDEFLKETKLALSRRVEGKEKEMNKDLKEDIKKRQAEFKRKHDVLLREFADKKKELEKYYQDRYKMRIESNLHREVASEFNKKLNEKFKAEKERLNKSYKILLEQHAKKELQTQQRKLDSKAKKALQQKINSLKKQSDAEILSLKRQSESKVNFFKKLFRKKQEHAGIRKRHSLETQFRKKVSKEIEKEKQSRADIKNMQMNLEKEKQNFILQKRNERKKLKEKLVSEAHKKIQSEIAKKEVALRKQLQSEFDFKLKQQIQNSEAEIKKRKVELELEMQKKIKQVLN